VFFHKQCGNSLKLPSKFFTNEKITQRRRFLGLDFDLIPYSPNRSDWNRPKGGPMPQIQLPVFPAGVTHITPELAFSNVNGQITYFNGSMPVFIHDAKDTKTFRMITSQFCVNGATCLVEISKAFGVPAVSVKRAVKLYRKEGPSGFFKDRKVRGKSVLTEKVVKQAQDRLNQFIDPKEIAAQLKIKPDTLRKAIQSGRLHRPEKKVQP
jgi:hypothetical protein